MSLGARVFVALVFFILGLSFVATTATLVYEFGSPDDLKNPLAIGTTTWFDLASFYSHLFIFFPTFGLVALWAFYTPAVCFVDLYWKHVQPFGRLRFLVGFAVVAVLSFVVAEALRAGDERSMFEIRPTVLSADTGAPARCDARSGECDRLPVLQALENLRTISHNRTGLSEFARNCRPDPLRELPSEFLERRYCFVKGTLPAKSDHFLDGSGCCAAQQSFANWLSLQHKTPNNRSLTGEVHNVTLPLKVFFLIVLVVVGALLAVWRRTLQEVFAKSVISRIERGVLIGALVMLFWPIMNHAFMQSALLLYGNSGESTFRYLGPGFSIAFGAWGLLLLLFFYRRFERNLELIGKVAGLVSAGIAVVQYDLLVDQMAWFAGSGASIYTIGVLVLLGVMAFVSLFWRIKDDASEGMVEGLEAAGSAVEAATGAASDAVGAASDTIGHMIAGRSESQAPTGGTRPGSKEPPIV